MLPTSNRFLFKAPKDMNKIPKIIHQIWSETEKPLPDFFKKISKTWIRDYPDWEYMFWDNNSMNEFILNYYPQFWTIYNDYPYNIQRWDAIRYLILDTFGGMYVDFDYESIKPMNDLLFDKYCCFSSEPPGHFHVVNSCIYFNNALMLSIPEHPFIKKIISKVFSYEKDKKYDVNDKFTYVMSTTGPKMLTGLYESLEEQEKDSIYIIPHQYVSPLDISSRYLPCSADYIWQGS